MRCRRKSAAGPQFTPWTAKGGPAGGGADGRTCPAARNVTVWISFLGTNVHLMLSPSKSQSSFGKKASAWTDWSLVSPPTYALYVV